MESLVRCFYSCELAEGSFIGLSHPFRASGGSVAPLEKLAKADFRLGIFNLTESCMYSFHSPSKGGYSNA
jgi:hypothetical protein